MTIKQEELTYNVPANPEPGSALEGESRHVDLILTYDDAAPNVDGSYTVTNVTGTYQTINSDHNVVHTDTVGYVEPGDYIGNNNKIFITSDPSTGYVDSGGISFTISDPDDTPSGNGLVNFYGGGDPFTYQEADENLPNATDVEEHPACYLRGTMILTATGEMAIEALKIGDRVVTGSGALQPVKWIGRRSFSARFAGGKHRIQPIRIAAGALGDNLPKRDLWVSPCHAMLVDGFLIPAARLVNGITITQPEATQDFDYFHIELDRHDVVVAEGALSETYLDQASRNQFHNAAEFRALYPQARPDPNVRFCAPRVEHGFEFQAVLKRLKHRAAA